MVRAHLPALLIDQAHLEKKAAAAAVNFLFRLPLDAGALRPVSALAREELLHFERTLRLLAARGIAFAPQPPAPYAERLKAAAGRTMPQRLVDELLLAALIEARSHERMDLLAREFAADDAEIAAFYAELCVAEARHESVYVDLAQKLAPVAAVRARHDELRRHEAAVLAALPWSARLHGGLGESAHG